MASPTTPEAAELFALAFKRLVTRGYVDLPKRDAMSTFSRAILAPDGRLTFHVYTDSEVLKEEPK